LPRSRHEGRPKPPHNVNEGCAHTAAAPPLRSWKCSRRLRVDWDFLCDGPHEGEEFARDRGGDHIGVLAAREEPAVALAQPDLRLPSDLSSDLWERSDAPLDVGRDLRWVTIGPRAFDQDTPCARVAGLGDSGLTTRLAARVLGRRQPDVGG